MSQGWIGVDFDACLAEYHGWQAGRLGKPIPVMVERVKRWLAAGIEVRIFTARVGLGGGFSTESGRQADHAFVAEQRQLLTAWCEEHIGQALPITAEKDFRLMEFWDDRAIQVRPNTGTPVDPLFQEFCASNAQGCD